MKTILLSRVADSFYWLGRYVERAENTARLLIGSANLALDLPRRSRLDWGSLVAITGAQAAFDAGRHNPTEMGVMRFLIADMDNPGSIRSSIVAARENLRRTRDRVPREVTEALNRLHALVAEGGEGAIRRTAARHAFLHEVVDRCQILRGYLGGTMSHGLGYRFIRCGRLLERADMTTRIMDVRLDDLLPDEAGLPPAFEAIQWMAVLRSLSAYQMYRREMHGTVRGRQVIEFLFLSPDFPRSLQYCINGTGHCVRQFPNHEGVIDAIDALLAHIGSLKTQALSADDNKLRRTIDELQVEINGIHGLIARTYLTPHVIEQ